MYKNLLGLTVCCLYSAACGAVQSSPVAISPTVAGSTTRLANQATFYEGNGCTQFSWGGTDHDLASMKPNDEARSVRLSGPTGTFFSVLTGAHMRFPMTMR
jgi:hypothetical protein